MYTEENRLIVENLFIVGQAFESLPESRIKRKYAEDIRQEGRLALVVWIRKQCNVSGYYRKLVYVYIYKRMLDFYNKQKQTARAQRVQDVPQAIYDREELFYASHFFIPQNDLAELWMDFCDYLLTGISADKALIILKRYEGLSFKDISRELNKKYSRLIDSFYNIWRSFYQKEILAKRPV